MQEEAREADTAMHCKPPRAGIATSNPGKINALKKVLARYCGIAEVNVIRAPEGLPEQPVGSIEVVRGAVLRALESFKALNGKGYGFGLEAGPLEFYTHNGYIEAEVAAVIGPQGRVSIGVSSMFPLPSHIVGRMKHGVPLGGMAPRRAIDTGDSIGYIGVLTWGGVTRVDLHVQALTSALIPWISGFQDELEHYSALLDRLS